MRMSSEAACPDANDSASGFALIELLVALALLGLIMAVIAPTIGMIAKTAASIERRAEATSYASVENLLRQLLEQARSPRDPGQETFSQRIDFIGTSDALTFVSSFTSRGMRSGLYRYELALNHRDVSPQSQSLILRYRQMSATTLTDHKLQAGAVILVDDVKEFALRYSGYPRRELSPHYWKNEWSHSPELPSLISIRIKRHADIIEWSIVGSTRQ